MTGPVLWTSDRYGSRFAVTAPITTAEQPVRWYLWDIDACGHEAFTVHSGYYPSSGAALTDWQTGVGQTASAGTVLAPVDDPSLLAALLPAEMGFMRPGGENIAQFAEYHRSKRLAEAVNQALPRPKARSDAGLTAATAAAEFAAWLHARVPGQPEPPENLDELVGELADSWNLNSIDAVYATCSRTGSPCACCTCATTTSTISPTNWWRCCPTGPDGWPHVTPPRRSWPTAACPTHTANHIRSSATTTRRSITSRASSNRPSTGLVWGVTVILRVVSDLATGGRIRGRRPRPADGRRRVQPRRPPTCGCREPCHSL